eukprot:m.55783 g.55783  ORF g.55783 m.55783 type:complete len:183 (+) comp13343_c0_seq2:35-583(+)
MAGLRALALAVLALAVVGCADDLTPCETACNNSARSYTDAEVIAQTRPFVLAWRDQFNQGNYTFCGDSYTEDAVMYANLGAAAAFLKQKVGLPNPTVMRGRDQITSFWQTGITVLGLADFRAYEPTGYYSNQVFVVNDNKIISQCNFSMNAISGVIHGETWIRVGDGWQLETDFFEIRALYV